MSALGPRRSEPEAWYGWLREALALIGRRPFAFAGYAVAMLLLLGVTHGIAWAPMRTLLLLLVTVLALVLFIRLALVADYNREASLLHVVPGNLDAALALTVAAALFAAYGALTPGFFEPLADSLESLLEGLGVYEGRLESGAPAPPPTTQAWVGPVFTAGGVW
ncbi:hypothetical protein CKO15_08835, partial [Halorhodospira abdelmalekii]|uniref:hypothetical protein n=1 Tax=Halorhodospira abdelmalekii TaxID=421629 RepID=UPI00190602E6